MAQFTLFEKILARFLSRFPFLKKGIKRSYQTINFIIYRKKHAYKSKFPIVKIASGNKESFFGYYDNSPINESNEYILFHSVEKNGTKNVPDSTQPIKIYLTECRTSQTIEIDESYAYNWQQGTKLQWLNTRKFIYNAFEDGMYISKIIDVTSKSFIKKIKIPIYDCFQDIFALSLNFNRLHQLRPDYGYRKKNEAIDYMKNHNDGIFHIDFLTGNISLIITIERLIALHKKPSMHGAKHLVNHIMISPDGNHFVFLHRWITSRGIRFDSLVLSDSKGERVSILADDNMVSHCCWYGNEHIIGYLTHKMLGDQFYTINIKTNDVVPLSTILSKFGDGHPSFFQNKMVCDSYPNKARYKQLFIFNKETEEIEDIGEFLEPLNYNGETRCDLHPRWSLDGKSIFFDSVHEGKRHLYMTKLGL